MYFKLNQLAMVSLLSVGVVGTASANVYIDHQNQNIHQGSVLTAKSDLTPDQMQNPKVAWKDEKGSIIGTGKQLSATPDILGNSQNVMACISYINPEDQASNIECSDVLPLDVQTFIGDPRIHETMISGLTVGKFVAPTETVTLSFDVMDADNPAGADVPLTDDQIDEVTYTWFIGNEMVKEVNDKSDKSLIVPTTYGSPAKPVTPDLTLKVFVTVMPTSDVGSGSGKGQGEFDISENYPGGNIADGYYRPMLASETMYDEKSKNIVNTDENGIATTGVDTGPSDNVYGFAAIPHSQAVIECESRTPKLRLVDDATVFSNYLNTNTSVGGLTEHWPNDVRYFWTNTEDHSDELADYYGYFMGVAYLTVDSQFKALGQDPDSLALVVCEDIPGITK
ncbi:hypothetical protein [Aliivibrio fischeri]|uniref:hypothetical protein n=1 Tax=Aliivibrio fischeri TaxID=668 RepID=UPI00080E49D5|nr:hypothetical protein [Aliivibrio fischeri]OCH41081.1 hypothetical protein A6E02_15835 [Aliivibrio fischeri]OED57216.1 hypothetical protein BEI47_11445 [Aliivibrio fischeri]